MTIQEVLENALSLLEANGYKGGDIHDDLALALSRLRIRYPEVAREEFDEFGTVLKKICYES